MEFFHYLFSLIAQRIEHQIFIMPKAHKEFKNELHICKHCGKEFYPRYSSRGLFCCLQCSFDYKLKEKYTDYLKNEEDYDGKINMKWIKPHILEEQDHKCQICNMSDIWQNKHLVFILDHIDGRANNNKRNNLRLICPNCDSQLDTYKSKNKNSDRIKRYLKKG